MNINHISCLLSRPGEELKPFQDDALVVLYFRLDQYNYRKPLVRLYKNNFFTAVKCYRNFFFWLKM